MPLFWFRRASDGFGPERYTVQIPFQFGPNHALIHDSERKTFSLDKLSIEIVENKDVYLLRVTGFRSNLEAETFLPRLHGALLRLTVVKKLSLRANATLQKPVLRNPPIEVRDNSDSGGLMKHLGWTHLDGWVNPSPAIVIPEHLRLLENGIGSMKFILRMPVGSFIDGLQEGLDLPSAESVVANDRLSLAIDLYAASLWEGTRSARVISLATTLEALIKREKVKPLIQTRIDELLQSLDNSRDTATETAEERSELKRLRSRLTELGYESISQRLRHLAEAHANVLGETPKDAVHNMKKVYDTRSKLLHEGKAAVNDIQHAVLWLQNAVPAILEAFVARACTPTSRIRAN